MFFGRIICKLYFFFANSLAYIDKKLFESKQTRHCKKKKLHKDTHICQFWPSFVYLMAASHSFLCANAICLIVCVFAFAVYFFFLAIAFGFCFSFDYLVLFNFCTIASTSLSTTYTSKYINTILRQPSQWSRSVFIVVVVVATSVVICTK